MTTTRSEPISGPDGDFSSHIAVPDSGSGPGLLIIQEIFGVNEYIKSVCDRMAAMGYVALAPDMFHAQEPGFVVEPAEGDEGMTKAFEKMGGFDMEKAPTVLAAALNHVRALPECTGDVGVMGFCFGGTMTFLTAADLDPVCAVSYYGSGVAGMLGDKADSVDCPILFHFGSEDPFLPSEDSDAVAARFADVDSATVVVQEGAGHAFDNNHNPGFSNPPAAAAAWEVTSAFLAEHLPV